MTAAKTTTAKGLHGKLAEVMAEAGRIPKNGTYSGQGGFKYVMVGDAADAIRTALGSRGVSMLPTAVEIVNETEHATKSGGTMTTLSIRTTWTLVDSESGETAVIQSIGTGADAGDKASPKAQSNAMKYALLMGFLLSTGDDPEQYDSSDRQSKETTQVGTETLELMGNLQKSGKIAKGTATAYQLDWREEPQGHAIGFRINIEGDDRSIPQVIVRGSIGEALYLETAGDGSQLIGTRVSFKGKLYNVRQPGRTTYFRLVIGDHPDSDFIETPDVRIPALVVSPLREPDEPEEAPTLPLPMEPLTDDEKDAIAGGLPGA